jgi:hypothetical protein
VASFRTKRGRCVLTDDELRIESGLLSHARRYWEGNKALLAAYLALYAVLVLASLRVVARGDWDALVFGTLVVAALVLGGRVLNHRRGVTSDDRIALHDVEAVEAVEGDDWLTRPRFVVHHWSGGEIKYRYVMMPSGLLSYGEREFDRAIELFRQAGVPVERVDPGESSA